MPGRRGNSEGQPGNKTEGLKYVSHAWEDGNPRLASRLLVPSEIEQEAAAFARKACERL